MWSKFNFPMFTLLLFLTSAELSADDKYYTRIFSNVAVGGYDPVAYFALGKAVTGSKAHELEYGGVVWRFSNAKHKQMFANDTDKYLPQYGGHCAWAVAEKNKLVSADPRIWKIVDGKLYLNYDQGVQDKWEKDIPGFIEKADRTWPALNKD